MMSLSQVEREETHKRFLAGSPIKPMPDDFMPEISTSGNIVTGRYSGVELSFYYATTQEYDRMMAWLKTTLWFASERKRIGHADDR